MSERQEGGRVEREGEDKRGGREATSPCGGFTQTLNTSLSCTHTHTHTRVHVIRRLLGFCIGRHQHRSFIPQQRVPKQPRGEQHVTVSQNTDDIMPRLRRTLALGLWCWCLLLAHQPASADEEAPWGWTPSTREKPPQKKSYWWTPTLPKLPSLPSLLFSLPFYPSEGKAKASESATSAKGLLEPIEHSGSGDGGLSEASDPPTASTRRFPTSVTKIRTETLPTGTSHLPHNDTLVADSNSPTHIRNAPLTRSPTSTSTPEQNGTHAAEFVPKISATLMPETTLPTVGPSKEVRTTTINPGMGITQPLGPPETTPHLTQSVMGAAAEPPGLITTAVFATTTGPDHKWVESGKVNARTTGAEAHEEGAADADGRTTDDSAPRMLTTSSPEKTGTTTGSPQNLQTKENWMPTQQGGSVILLPDRNKEQNTTSNISDDLASMTSSDMKPVENGTATNKSNSPAMVPPPLMLVPLYTDWNSAVAAWGLAWEAHVYGAGCVFAMLTLASALNLLCLPLRCPSGCGYFALVSLFLLAAGCTRSFTLLYDAYGHQDRLPSGEASLMLYEAPFPCLTAAFGLVFLLLSMRSRMQLSYSAFQRPCFLACLVSLHFATAFGPMTLLKFYQQKPALGLFLSLISRGAFVALATFLSAAYFVFYAYVRADSKHIYHLNNTSPTPAERYNRCPFADSRDWDRAAVTVCLSALFCLACAGLQLYAMLNALGVAGGEEVFHPWCWWAFQFSCRLCELGVCLTLALVVAQPVYCSDQLPSPGSCWTELLASKAPILPGNYQWSLSQQEKLAIVDTVGLGETESLPLYTLMDERLTSSLNGLDFLYHSNRALAYRDLDVDLDLKGSQKLANGDGEEPSRASSFTSDSTTDLRPPSPINLRRSIDEALFSEALFPMSLFSTARPIQGSDLSIHNHCAPPTLCDSGLYRTSSCADITSKVNTKSQDIAAGAAPSPSLSSSSCSSPERWRASSSSSSPYRASIGDSSLVLCPSPETHARQILQQGDLQRHYQTLGAASEESLDLDMSSEADRSVQEEFISVCRQIDALSICSETIDL
ncbi:proline-rich transmembrane protein 4 [Dunckerocampus dactyliophorus]|uniref:proline-rich transmembrane protein 4 n=1 Tax=Dunckerocampus dactyliophorus TaxID=161453 RepID=UPI002405EA36|nr:proline-rich transmembrane protein 4 [Dunckerocampus dactyliophorus]